MKDNFKILGIPESATDEEVYAAYSSLKAKYREDMFLDGKKGNDAAKKLTELEQAYEEITSFRRERADKSDDGLLKSVDEAIKAGDIKRAQEILDGFNERSAEWHYLQAVVFYKKGWTNDSKKQLEIARQMKPGTEKYDNAYEKLIKKNDGGAKKNASGGGYADNFARGTGAHYDEPQMGGEGCLDFCVRLAICNLCLNCCCGCR